MRSNRWLPHPEDSESTACDLVAGVAVACFPPKPPGWLDMTRDLPAWTCARPPGPACPERPLVSCRGVQGRSTPGQTIIRESGTDLVLNGVSLWDPWDHSELVLLYPLAGGDHLEVLC